MKKRFTGIMMMVIFLVSAGTLWADLGLSIQAMGGYVLDRGKAEDGIKKSAQESLNEFMLNLDSEDHFDNLLLADVALFVEYNFWYRFFIRSGVEYSTSIDDVKSEGEDTGVGDYYTIHHSYEYIGIPLILGVNIPINRGMYNVYMGMGPCYNMVTINREGDGYIGISASDEYELDADGIGVVSIIGINTRVFRSVAISIELTYHDFSTEKEYEIEAKDSSGFTVATANQKYVFAAPKTSIRLGVRYSI